MSNQRNHDAIFVMNIKAAIITGNLINDVIIFTQLEFLDRPLLADAHRISMYVVSVLVESHTMIYFNDSSSG